MNLYLYIMAALFVALLVSVTDCRSNDELMIQRTFHMRKATYNFIFICLIFTFWFLTAFRGSSIGNDTPPYLYFYREIVKSGINKSWQIELGYQYFCLLLSKINPSPQFLLIVSATICYGTCGIYIYKKSKNILFSSVLLFCFAFSFFASGIRQAIAMAIVLIAYSKIKDGKKLFPIILIIFAATFHVSALIALLWFAHRIIPKDPISVILLAMVVSLLAALGSLDSMLMTVLEKYQAYFEADNVGTGRLGIAYYAFRAAVFYSFIYIASRENKEAHSIEISNAILLLITVCLGFSVNAFSRASLYYLLAMVADIPNEFNSGKIKNRDMWILIIGIVMIAYFMVTLILRPEWNNLYPYEFYWD